MTEANTTDTNNGANTPAQAEAPKRTRTPSTATVIASLEGRKAALSAELARITDELTAAYQKRDAEDAAAAARTPIEVDGLPAGTSVSYNYGRKDGVTTLTGTVLGFRPKTDKTPAAYRIMHGEGIEAELHTVTANNVIAEA